VSGPKLSKLRIVSRVFQYMTDGGFGLLAARWRLGSALCINQIKHEMRERDGGMDGWMDDDVWPLFVIDGCSCIETWLYCF
jgi:hypothetical protein